MSNQTASSYTQTTLIAPNYAKPGYGFAGWIASENATPYGPNATITTPDLSTSGLKLYAKWVASAGDLQGWNGCNAMTTGTVTALTDIRDNNTYLVAKLADDNCWIAENLRLNPSTATITVLAPSLLRHRLARPQIVCVATIMLLVIINFSTILITSIVPSPNLTIVQEIMLLGMVMVSIITGIPLLPATVLSRLPAAMFLVIFVRLAGTCLLVVPVANIKL